jgi:D-amino-acid oxidase
MKRNKVSNEGFAMNIAVVGGGIFGITAVLKLAELGHEISLFEKNGKILRCASFVNQYCIHRGYHYPRSKETAINTRNGLKSFEDLYGECLLKNFEHYYCISRRDSLTSSEEFIEFCKELNLKYEIVQPPGVIKKNSISLCVKVKEDILSPSKLMKFCEEKLNRINVIFEEFRPSDTKNYDLVIGATYANQNYLLKNYPEKQVDYQFECIEKLVLKLPEEYKKLSIVIIDGSFMCVAPFDRTGSHLMGNVEVAIHSRNIGKFPEITSSIKPLLNKGIIKNPKVTKFDEFISAAREFFVNIDDAKHEGSMFTVRTVYPYHEHDDARPTVVEKIDNLITVFSGKIPTCVKASDEIIEYIKNDK